MRVWPRRYWLRFDRLVLSVHGTETLFRHSIPDPPSEELVCQKMDV